MYYRNYLIIAAIGTIVLVSTIGAFNFFIDPYRIYNSPKITGINLIKPEQEKHVRLSKAIAISHIKPDAIVLGNSRSEYGISPSHPGWLSDNTYNLAIPGANLYEMLRYFDHANGTNNLKQVVAGLDFYMFNIYRGRSKDFDDAILKYNEESQINPNYSATKIYKLLFSIDLFFDALRTILKQSYKQTYREDGQLDWHTNQLNVQLAGGHRKYFLKTESRFLNGIWLPGPDHLFKFDDPVSGKSTFMHYRRLLSTAHKNNIDLRIFISPSHARMWEALYAAGLWDEWETWKIKLVYINNEIAQHYNKTPFPIWDFSGYNDYTTETVPPHSDTTSKMNWYWESSHYKKELGDLVLDRIFHSEYKNKDLSVDFGALITSDNINSHLSNIREQRSNYAELFTDDIHEISLLKKVAPNPNVDAD